MAVYVFNSTTYTGYSRVTDANGQATFTIPQGSYRFRADFNGTQFWSGGENHCTLPGCESASMTTTKPVTVTVAGQTGEPYANLNVYAFNGSSYTGYSGTTDEDGHVNFTLPQGSYRFRADYDGVQFWSSTENSCAIPGCETATVGLPGGFEETTVTINYAYDPLYRLTEANYSTEDYYHYAYDAVGNRLTQEILVSGLATTDTYTYDIANRLVDVDGVASTWDANSNLLNDGTHTYEYDLANRLVEVSGQSSVSGYQYNGLGDRLTQNGIQYTLDLNAGLTQVLADGENMYLYGNSRIAQVDSQTEYFLGDALGSVRQLANADAGITLTKSYAPYGEMMFSAGNGESVFAYTGEQQDASGLTYLRARYYDQAWDDS